MKVKAELDGRDILEADDSSSCVTMVGCTQLLRLMQDMRARYGQNVKTWPLPEQHDHSSLLLRELILKLRGEWEFPYTHEELCHCRSIPAKTVDQAIIAGAHTTEKVSRQTTASTACGTCRPEVQKIIDFRLGKK